jgi:hypothetical protein
MAAHVFLSYSKKDQAAADRLLNLLKAAGLDVWSEQAVDPGDDWQQVIESALSEATAGVILVSEASLNSAWSAHEYRYFLTHEKPLYVAQIEDVEPSKMPYALRSVPTFDLTQNFNINAQRLIQALQTDVSAAPKPDSTRITVEIDEPLGDVDAESLTTLLKRLSQAGFHDIDVQVKSKPAND